MRPNGRIKMKQYGRLHGFMIDNFFNEDNYKEYDRRLRKRARRIAKTYISESICEER